MCFISVWLLRIPLPLLILECAPPASIEKIHLVRSAAVHAFRRPKTRAHPSGVPIPIWVGPICSAASDFRQPPMADKLARRTKLGMMIGLTLFPSLSCAIRRPVIRVSLVFVGTSPVAILAETFSMAASSFSPFSNGFKWPGPLQDIPGKLSHPRS